MRRPLIPLALAAATVLAAPSAAEARCGAGGGRWVEVTLAGVDDAAAEAVLGHLAAGLAREGAAVCRPADAGGAAEPAARVAVTLDGSHLTVEVDDALTDKRLRRDADLAAIPEDGRPLAIAAAAEELLRASWAEIELERARVAPPPPTPPAPEPPPIVTRRAAAPPPRLGARLALSSFGGGQTHFGGDAWVRFQVARRIGVELAAGGRDGGATTTVAGEIRARSLSLGASLLVGPWQDGRVALDLDLGVHADAVAFDAAPAPGYDGQSASGLALYARLGLRPSLRVTRAFSLGATFALGVPLRAYSAADGMEVVTGVSGLELHLALGGGVAF